MIYSLRTIRYEHGCESVLNAIEREYGDNAIIGLEWALTRKPEEWLLIPGTNLYLARTFNPVIRAFFTFDDTMVFVRHVFTD